MDAISSRVRRRGTCIAAVLLTIVSGCSDGEDAASPSRPSSPAPVPGPPDASAASPAAGLDPVIACKRAAHHAVSKVAHDFWTDGGAPGRRSLRTATARLVERLGRLRAMGVCPGTAPALATLLDREPPTGLRAMRRFSDALAAWASSVGVRQPLPDFLDDPVWCVGHVEEYVRARWVPRAEAGASGVAVWLDVTYENLTDATIRGRRSGSLVLVDPTGQRRLREYDGRRVNRLVAGTWGGGTDGPVVLPASASTTMVLGDANGRAVLVPFEPVVRGEDIVVGARVTEDRTCTVVARPA